MFDSPFSKISKKQEKKITFSVLYLLVMTLTTMQFLNTNLTNITAPNGIISFEFSKTLERAQEILDSWSPTAKVFAGLNLGLDFLFLIIYTLFLALLIHKLNERLWVGKPFHKIGEFLVWSMFIAAIFDTVENVCLIKLLTGNMEQYWVSVAYVFALVKFILIIVAILYIISNFFILLLKKRS